MLTPKTGELIFFFSLLAVVAFFAYRIMEPYLVALFLAVVLTIVFHPVTSIVQQRMKGHRALAAGMVTLFVLCIILLPLILVGTFAVNEVVDVFYRIQDNGLRMSGLTQWVQGLEIRLQGYVPGFRLNVDIALYAEKILSWVTQNLNAFVSGTFSIVFDLILVIVALFFFLKDGDKLRAFAIQWSPLADRYDESILAKLEHAVSSVVKGALTTAVAQGTLVGIGFALFGVPNPVLWGLVATVMALIPVVGTTLVTFPAVLFLFFSGMTLPAIGLLLWAIVCVGLIDNVLHPLLVKRGVAIHPFLILLSVIGGLGYFGPIGFLAGPVVMAFFFALLELYPYIVKGKAIAEAK